MSLLGSDLFDRRRAMVGLAVLAALNILYAGGIVWREFVAPAAEAGAERYFPDFAAFWAAAAMTLEGSPAQAYDWAAHRAVESRGLGFEVTSWMPWLYPPHFQLVVTPFGLLPLWAGMAAWVVLTLAFYLRICWRILPDPLALAGALAAAPTAVILVNGQTGFLIAALMGLCLLELDRRPIRSGIALGLLSIKPQLALALPVALVAGGRWRVLGLAALVVAVLAALAWAALGAGTWAAFLGSVSGTAGMVQGMEDRFAMFGSLYGWQRVLGLEFGPAMAIHGAVALVILGLTAAAWRAPGLSADLKAALAALATAALTPRILNYDLHILVIGVLFQVRHALKAGVFPGEQLLIGVAALGAFLSVLFAPGVNGVLAPALFFGCWLGHVRRARTAAA